MRLGGKKGIQLKEVKLEIRGIQGFFNNFTDGPALVQLTGELQIDHGPSFTLKNAQIQLNQNLLPTFIAPERTTISVEEMELFEGFPIRITEAGLGFKDRELLLPDLVGPENIIISTSAEIVIEAEVVSLSGQVDDLSFEIEDGKTQVALDGFGFGIEALEIPPLGLSGEVYIRGLQDPGVNFENVYFSGLLGGQLSTAGVRAMVALTPQRLVGICLDVNAGPSGIPLGQTTLLFTGASGGVTFANDNKDPCEFLAEFPVAAAVGANPQAMQPQSIRPDRNINEYGMTWEDLDARVSEQIYRDAVADQFQTAMEDAGPIGQSDFSGPFQTTAVSTTAEQDVAGLEIPCPNADCPPTTVNILCQPHPDQELFPNKVIIKFTSLDRHQATDILDELGFTPEALEALGVDNATIIAEDLSEFIRSIMEDLIPPGLPELVGEDLAKALNAEREKILSKITDSFNASIRNGIENAFNEETDIYEAVLKVFYAGVPCPDVAVSLKGTFSQALVSSFLSVKGGGVLSSAGAVGLVGDLNIIGMPIGKFRGFAMGTDSEGLPNPSLCGTMDMQIGPISAAQSRMAFTCEECITGFLEAFGGLAGCLLNESGEAVETAIREALAKVAPQHRDLGAAALDAELSIEQKTALFAQIFHHPPEVLQFSDCFVNSLIAAIEAVNPVFRSCMTGPKIFGISMGGTVKGVQLEITKDGMAGAGTISPSKVFLAAAGAGSIFSVAAELFPPLDELTLSLGSEVFQPSELFIAALKGKLTSPEKFTTFIEDGFERMLTRTTYGIQHKFNPMGFDLLDNQARLVMPNLIQHPVFPSTDWQGPPESRGLPSRAKVLMAALGQEFLGNALWKGDEEDLHTIFPQGTPDQSALLGKSFGTDYFPHGGIVAAGRLALPSILSELPPEEIGIAVGNGDYFKRLEAAKHVVDNYILKTTNAGKLAMYLPAPNPPIMTNDAGENLTPKELFDAILSADPTQLALAPFYPVELLFIKGTLSGRILGVPIMEAELIGYAPNAQTGESGKLEAMTQIPSDSWLNPFLEEAALSVTFTQAPPLSIEDYFLVVQERLQSAITLGESQEISELETLLEDIRADFVNALPKASITASLDRLRIPEPFEDVLIPAETSASFSAFSPLYDPEVDKKDPLAEVKIKGGMAFEASAMIAGFLNMPEMVLSVIPPTATTLPSLHAKGKVEPFEFPPGEGFQLFEVVSPIGDDTLEATADFNSDGSVQISIDPIRVSSPLITSGNLMRVYGEVPTEPLSIRSNAPWSATLEFGGASQINFPDGTPALRFGEVDDKFQATIKGEGMDQASIHLEMNHSLNVTAFPGNPNLEQIIPLDVSSNQGIELFVNSDGTFYLEGSVGENFSVPLVNLPVTELKTEARVRISNEGMRVEGKYAGGALSLLGIPEVTGLLEISLTSGVLFEANASIPASSLPLHFGVFEVDALRDGGNIPLIVSNTGFEVGSSVLSIPGISADVITLESMQLLSNGDFTSIGSNGGLSLPNFFSVASGSFSFVKEGPDVSLSFAAPSVTLLPNSPMETVLQAPVDKLLIESNGRMYVDSGRQTIPLPGFASATGRVEFGYEPEGAMPLPEVDVRLVDFGVVDVGSNAVKTVRVTNLGGATLVGSSVVELEFPTFQVTPPLYVLEPGEAIDLEVYYFPKTTERVNGVLNLPSTRFEDLKVVLTGQGRSRPQFHTSVTDVLDFGEQAVGGGLNRQLSISNLGTETLRVTESQLTGPFTVSPSTFEIAPGKTQGLFLTFRPNAQEGYVSKLTWQTNEPEKSRSLNLVGVGTQVRWYEQRDSGPIIRDLFMVNAKVGWAVGDQGTLLKTTTGGRAWTPYKSPTMRTLNAVAFGSDGVKGWIAGDAGTVFETEDSGVTWAPVTHEEVQNPALSWKDAGVSGQRLVLVGEDSSNGQAALTYQNTNTSYRSVEISGMQGLYGVSTHEKWVGAVGSNGLLVYSFNGGIRWKESYIDGASAVRFNGVTIDENGSAVAVAGGGLVYHTIKLGESWSRIEETNTTQNLFAAERSGDSLWVSGASGVLIHSVDGGANWTTESINTGASLYAVASKEGLVWAAGRRGEIHHRPDESPSTPRLLLSSDRLDFGVRLPGQVSSQSIVVRNDGPETMTFESASVTGDSEFSVQGIDLASLAPGQSARIRVLFSPAEPGLKTGAIVLRPVGDLLDSFEISYRGESAGSSWSPIATPTTEHVEDLQFLNDQLGFAIDEDEVYRTEDGGESWNALNANPPGPLKRIKFLNPTIGFGYGGKGGSNSTLIKTTDGGSTWKVLDTGVRHRITDVVAPIPGNAQILFAMTKWYAGGNNNKYAVILRSTNGGDSWTTIGRPSQVFLGGEAIHVQSNLNTLFVAGGNILYRSTNGGSSWTQVLKFSGSKLINDIEFLDDNHGWLVGESGLFRRTETGGASSSDWLKPASLSAGKLRRIRFIDSNNGWIAGEGSFSNNAEPALFRTIDGGRTWSNTLVDGDFTVRSVSPISADQAFAGGTDGNLVEYTPAETVSFGLITATEVVDFGEVEQGELASGSVEYANVGDKAVKLLGLQFDIEKSVGAFRYEGSVPESLAPGASFQVDVFFRSGSAGGFDDSLRLLNDGFSSVVETDLSAVVSMSEGILILDTHPSGLPLIVSGIEQVTPIAFTIRPGTDGETGVVSPGEKLSIEAPETIQQSFLSYQFVDWKPFQKRQFILEVPEFSSRFEAQYEGVLSSRANVIHQPVPGRIPSPRPRATTPPVLVSEILGSVDPPPGPWIRLSGPGLQEAAEISHPLLGEFPLNISAYFSSKEFELSLGSRILQIPNDAVTGDEWLSVNPGSLDLSYREGEWFRLLAASGSVSIWGVPSPGAGHVSFDFNPPTDQVLIPPTNQVLIPPTKPGATPASAGYRAVLTLDSDTSILPNIFEFGAGSQLVFDTHGEPSMEFNGRLRMFKSPTEDWVYNKDFVFNVGLQEFEIEVDDLVANSPIWSNGFIRLLVGSNSPRLFFRKGSNGYEGGISNLQLGLFGESITVAEAVAGSDGNFSLTIDQGEIELNNLMRLKTDKDSQLKWNIFDGAYELNLSKGNIDIVNSDAWPVNGVPLPGFQLTGSSFQETFDFEPFQFSGIPLSEPQQGDSYFRLNGSNEEIGFAVFGEFSTQIGNLTVEIHITSDGRLTASASGKVSNDFFSSSTELVYDSANVKWPFSGTFTVGPVEYCVRVGPSNNGEIPRGEIYVCP
ncbi:MAG: choice-of-anchor D domain-containing protein [Verrucomicrobiota bacterium]|nr:choice-of-anchor D domain-containing protein [Verrucomicrobiota bacterium]